PAPEWLSAAVYGLPELRRAAIQGAQLVANPGCFPTAAILALAPAFAANLITPEAIVDAKTGITGAGRSPSRRVHFSEMHDSLAAYGLAGHRHTPEMVQALTHANAATPPAITFVPHLVPMNRGILATCYATLRAGITEAMVHAAYQAQYEGELFITLCDAPPETGWVRGSNRCLLSLHVQGQRLIVVSAIDNLMKGGAGQAIQNANLLFGLPETAGLALEGLWP
nr:N-acetyl-gamma-glutamyl-phosphate reductase [Ktedonobacterales bacterium]